MSEQFTEEAIMIYDQTKDLVIKDTDDYAYAGTLGRALSDLEKTIKSHYAPLKKAAHAAHKAITTQESEDLKQPNEAKTLLKRAMLTYEDAQEKIRLEEERKANEAIQKKAEEDRKKSEEEGHGEPSTPFDDFVPEVKVAPKFQASGHTRDNWKGDVRDYKQFLESVAASGRYELITVNQSALNKYAAQMKDKALIPGVAFKNEKIKVM